MKDLEKFQLYINGSFYDGDKELESLNPHDNEPWAIIPLASQAQTQMAVESAHNAFYSKEWSSINATQRGKLLYKLADLVVENADKLAHLETKDTGKIIRETTSQTKYVGDYIRYYAGLADKVQGASLPIDKPDMEVFLLREPVGVVSAVVPWNSQLFLSAVKFAPAIAAGCTIVLKASENAPTPLLELAKLIDKVGFPKGVFNIITGMGEDCGKTLTNHKNVSKIAFTGGVNTAKMVVANSCNNLANVSLELGGKSPVVVFDDVDVDKIINGVVSGIFAASGQSCVAGSRLIVHKNIKDEVLQKLCQKAEKIAVGNPIEMATEFGPLATKAQVDNIHRVIKESVDGGAKILTGGADVKELKGNYFQPTILDCTANRDVPSWREELFGPILSVVSFEDEQEAVALANDSSYGLASGVFTNNLMLAHRMVKAIRSGIVWVNNYRAVSPIVPFGGYGDSGLGREGGSDSILEYTKTKSVWIRTSDESIPDPFVMS